MKSYFSIFGIILVFLSCTKEIDNSALFECNNNAGCIRNILVDSVPKSVIGGKRPNPLDISIVKEAFSQLDPVVKSGFTEEDIRATHKYIAFTPSSDEELGALDAIDETKILLSTYPLDYEVSDGVITSDPRFMLNGYSYQWAYVPIDYDLSGIDCPYVYYYDIYAYGSVEKTKGALSLSLAEALEIKANELCGIELKRVVETKSGVTPHGRVRFFDSDSLFSSYRGVEGLSIRTVRAVWSSYTHCDSDGYFTATETYNYAFRYEIHFSRTDFSIRKNDTTSEVVIKYSNYTGPLYKDILDDEFCYYANISRAAIVYYYGDNCGLRRPPMRSDNTLKLAIQAHLGEDPNAYGYFYENDLWILGDRPKLEIFRESNSTRRLNINIYSTVMHELGHASHWRNNQSNFNEADGIVLESFARGVQWLLTKSAYPSYSGPQYRRQSYTGIVQDLIDGYGYKSSSCSSTWVDGSLVTTFTTKSYYDNVTGFTPSQIEEAARHSRDWSSWRAYLVVQYPSVAPVLNIWSAFDYWDSE